MAAERDAQAEMLVNDCRGLRVGGRVAFCEEKVARESVNKQACVHDSAANDAKHVLGVIRVALFPGKVGEVVHFAGAMITLVWRVLLAKGCAKNQEESKFKARQKKRKNIPKAAAINPRFDPSGRVLLYSCTTCCAMKAMRERSARRGLCSHRTETCVGDVLPLGGCGSSSRP